MFTLVTLIMSIKIASAQQAAQTQPSVSGGSREIWQTMTFVDNFDSGSDYTSQWSQDLDGWKGTAPGMFDNSLVNMHNGKIQLMSRWQGSNSQANGDDDMCNCGFENIATSMIVTKKKFKYGFFEARVRATPGTSFMNSFWLQGDHSEINIFELFTGSKQARSNFHCWNVGSDGSGSASGEDAYDISKLDINGFHTYGLDWHSDKLTLYLNGKAVRTITKSKYAASHPTCMDEPMNIILSVETNKQAGIPEQFKGVKIFAIDYVRHWGKKMPTPPSDGRLVRSCKELGWTTSKHAKPGYKEICSHPSKPFGKCNDLTDKNNFATHAEAEKQCTAIGARLCTSNELKGNVAKLIGCNFAQRRYQHTADRGTCYNGNSFMLSWGFNHRTRKDICVYQDRKAPFRCCAGPVVGKAEGIPQKSAGVFLAASDTSPNTNEKNIDGGYNAANPTTQANSTASTLAVALGLTFLVALTIAGVTLNRRGKRALERLSQTKTARNETEDTNLRRGSFEQCIDTVSESSSLSRSTDDLLHGTIETGPEISNDFEENGFVLSDKGDSVRIKSVRRGNPAFLSSVYIESEAIGEGAIDKDSTM